MKKRSQIGEDLRPFVYMQSLRTKNLLCKIWSHGCRSALDIFRISGFSVIVSGLEHIRVYLRGEIGRRVSGNFLEDSVKASDICETAFQRDVDHSVLAGVQPLDCLFNTHHVDVSNVIHSHEFFEGLGKMTWRKVHHGRDLFKRQLFGIMLVDIIQ